MPSLNHAARQTLQDKLVSSLASEPEVRRIVLFGSFLSEESPADMDVAVFQDSNQPYLPLAMKYRRLTREIAKNIALDILPLKDSHFSDILPLRMADGKVIYER